MRRTALWQQMMVPSGNSSTRHDGISVGFEELAMPLFDSVYNFAHWLAQDKDDAEDLVQETYLKALRGFASFQSGSNFRAWIFQILKNTFLAWRSRTRRLPTAPLDTEDDSLPELQAHSDTAESILVDRSRLDAVRVAIEQLPMIFREVILLCDVEEASYREISEALSIPIGTVMSRLARARKAVRESLRTADAPLRTSWPYQTATGGKCIETPTEIEYAGNSEEKKFPMHHHEA
jgi:RNA polymerase sigma-70 factor (ECF subfamily)